MKKIYIGVGILVAIALIALGMMIRLPYHVDANTRELCEWYASLDHEKEIDPQRYKWLGKEFVNNYDWYDSCINHVRYPVADN